MTGRVVVIGSLNADLTVTTEHFPEPGETVTGSELQVAPGGKSANQAVAAATLGATVRLIGAVGDDDHGSLATSRARAVGVDVSGVVALDQHATGTAMIVVDARGENTIIVSPGANGTLTVEALADVSYERGDVLCLALEIPGSVVLAAARAAHDAGAAVLLNLSPYAEVDPTLLELTDVLLVNSAEAERLVGSTQDWPATADALLARGIDRAVITLGGDGAVVLDATSGERVTTIDATSVDVVDTTGCGDAFTGAMAYRLAAGDPLVEAARSATRTAALAATASGAQSSYSTFARCGST